MATATAVETGLFVVTRVEAASVRPAATEWVLSERSLPGGQVERVVVTEKES